MLQPGTRAFRFTVLFFNCMLTFGSYFCFDMPSTLKSRFQQPTDIHQVSVDRNYTNLTGLWTSSTAKTEQLCQQECLQQSSDCLAYTWYSNHSSCKLPQCYTSNSSDHPHTTSTGFCENAIGSINRNYCRPPKSKVEVHLSSFQYESFYASYSWTNAVMSVLAGILVDKVGNHAALMLFSFNCVAGSALFALGAQLGIFPLMLVGRIIFGLGNGSLTIVQNKITSAWFKGHELALAFGFTMSFSRAGSVLNFNLSPNFCDKHGLVATLWGGCVLTTIGFISALTVSYLDRTGAKQLAKETPYPRIETGAVRKPMRLSDAFAYPSTYWFVVFALCFFYNGIFPFMAEAPDFIRMKYGKSSQMSGIIAGLCYDMSMVLSPFMGAAIDSIGRRGYLIVLCGIATFPTFVLLGFTHVTPFLPIILLGLTYSLAASAMWPSIALLVPMKSTGLAYGIVNFFQMVSIGICNFIIAYLREGVPDCPECKTIHNSTHCKANLSSWHKVMIFMLVNVSLCTICGIVLNFLDARRGRVLNRAPGAAKSTELDESASQLAINDTEKRPLLRRENHDVEPEPMYD